MKKNSSVKYLEQLQIIMVEAAVEHPEEYAQILIDLCKIPLFSFINKMQRGNVTLGGEKIDIPKLKIYINEEIDRMVEFESKYKGKH